MADDLELKMLRTACAVNRTGAWRYDITSNTVTWSAVTYDLFGLPPTQALDLEMGLSFFQGESRDRLYVAVQRCIETGQPYDLTVRCKDTEGRFFWAKAIGHAERGADDSIVALEGALQDISQERQAAADRQTAEQDLAFVLETMPDGFFLIGQDWRFLFVNGASQRMLQRDPRPLIGRVIWEEFPEAVGSKFDDVYRRVMARRESESFTAYFPPLETWFVVSAHPATEGIAVHFRDATEQMEERRQLKRFRTALDNMNSAAIMLDCVGEGSLGSCPIIYANRATATLAGPKNESDLMRCARDVVESLDTTPNPSTLVEEIRAGRSSDFEAQIGDPRVRMVEGVAVPIAEGEGPPGYAVLLLDDVTEARAAQIERQRNERLALLGQMAGGVSHDFNNLLAVILGNIELIELSRDRREIEELVAEARDAVLRGRSLNESLLAFAGRSRLEPREENVADFLRRIAPLVKRAVPSRIDLELRIEEDLPPVLLDIGMAESCVLNLVLNARDAISETGRIIIALEKVAEKHLSEHSGVWLRLSVTDDGCGIPYGLQERVFEPFFSTRGPAGGSGLGLSRVRGFVEQSGGFVSLRSAPGDGTEVAMSFPVAAFSESAPSSTDGGIAGGPQHLRALVVDDTSAVARVAARLLAAEGCRVEVANDGIEARRIVDGGEGFDLLLTDVVMRKENGLDLAISLKTSMPDLGVILMTGYPENELASALPEGFVLLRKPVSRSDLVDAIRRSAPGGALYIHSPKARIQKGK